MSWKNIFIVCLICLFFRTLTEIFDLGRTGTYFTGWVAGIFVTALAQGLNKK